MKKHTTAAAVCAVLIISGMFSACNSFDENVPAETTAAPAISENSSDSCDAVVFSEESGFYDKGFSLEISCAETSAKIYYTTDGSDPDENDTLYTAPIKLENRTSEPNVLSSAKGMCSGADYIPRKNVDKANVIRAVAVLPDGTKTEVSNGTFFIGIDREKKYANVPVISLCTDSKNLIDYDIGIFVKGKRYDEWLEEDPANASLQDWEKQGNYSNKGRDWERPVTVQYFDKDGKLAFTQDMGMRVMGAASRGNSQKSIRLFAREDYGKKSVEYEVIPDNMRSDKSGSVEKYKSFVLRNGGNDCDFAKVRDPYLQELAFGRNFETEQYIPCVVYIDGEYWGMYTLKESYSDNYIENNYGIDNKNVILVKTGEIEDGNDEDIELYYQMYDFITENDMSNADNYSKASEMLDVTGFADYCAFNLYIFNQDSIFKDNNWEMWRVREPDMQTAVSDGKWRMMVYDVDFSSGIYDGGSSFSQNNITDIFRYQISYNDAQNAPDYRHPVKLFTSLYENDDFRKELVNALCDIRNINFEKEHALNRLSEIADIYSKIVPDTFERFGPDWVANQDTEQYFSQKINELAVFIDGRYEKFPNIMQKALSLGNKAELTLSLDGGTAVINSSQIPAADGFKGIYFTDYDISVKALPDEGKKFVRWEYEGCTISDENSSEITVSFEGDFTLKAVFE